MGSHPRASRPLRALGVVVAVALTFAATASAADDVQTFQLTSAGETAARAAVLTRADMGSGKGWTGGAKKQVSAREARCADAAFHPKQSDLVVNGDVESVWSQPGFQYDSVAQVLKTAVMVQTDWQRSFVGPGLLGCLRSESKKGDGADHRLVSVRPLAFPAIGGRSAAYRFLYDYTTATGKERVVVDVVFVVQGRTEIRLTSGAAYASVALVHSSEIRLARILAGRIRV